MGRWVNDPSSDKTVGRWLCPIRKQKIVTMWSVVAISVVGLFCQKMGAISCVLFLGTILASLPSVVAWWSVACTNEALVKAGKTHHAMGKKH